MFPPKMVFAHISYTSFQTQMSSSKCCTKEILCTHRLYQIGGNICHVSWLVRASGSL